MILVFLHPNFSLSIIPSRSIHVVTKWQDFILFMTEWYSLYICTVSSLSIRINEHFSCFHILAVINNATVKIELSLSFQISVFILFG